MPRARIALLLGTHVAPHLDCLQGLRHYQMEHELDWDLSMASPENFLKGPHDADAWILHHARMLSTPQVQELVRGPTCTLFGQARAGASPCAQFDQQAFGTLAARAIHENNFLNAATVFDQRPEHLVRERQNAFLEAAGSQGLRTFSYEAKEHAEPDHLRSWLRTLPRPTAIYCGTDGQADSLRSTILDLGLRIPDDLAIVGTGDHYRFCVKQSPSLSTVSYPWKLLGRAAGHCIHHLLQGDTKPLPVRLRPYHVVERESSRPRPVDDDLVRRSIGWLQKHLPSTRPLQELAEAMAVSVPTICRQFKKCLRDSPQQVHNRLRLQKALALLSEESLSIAAVAKRSGFPTRPAFTLAFRRKYDCSPSEWRMSTL